MIPYTLGRKRLDKLYLDTTFAQKSNPFREFPSKAEGLLELLRKVEAYSDDTVFYFRAWTFGYEDVWLALSAALGTKVCGTFQVSGDHKSRLMTSIRSMWTAIRWDSIGPLQTSLAAEVSMKARLFAALT